MRTVKAALEAKVNPDLSFEIVENEIRRKNYGVLSTISKDGRPHSAGVMYAVSARSRPFVLYIVTDRRSKKARNIGRNPNISFVVPIHRSPGFLPPNSIQFRGRAEIIRLTDEIAKDAFNSSIILRRVLKMQLVQKPEVSTFIRIQPDPVLFTYGVGMTIFQLMKHIEGAASRVEIPTSRFEQGADSVA